MAVNITVKTSAEGGLPSASSQSQPARQPPHQFQFADNDHGDDSARPATGRAREMITKARGDGPGDKKTTAEGVRAIAVEMAGMPVIGGAARVGVDLFDKLKPLLAEMKATGRAAQMVQEVAQATPMQRPAQSTADGAPPRVVSANATAPAQAASQAATGRAAQIAEQNTTPKIPPAANTASNALANVAQAANAARTATNAAGAAANATTAAAAPTATGAATGAAGNLLATLGPLATFAAATGAAAIALKLGVDAANAFATSVKRRAGELADFSPQVANARARNEVAGVRANLRAGRDFGENFSRVEAVNGQFSRSMQRITDVIENRLLDKLLPLVEKIADGVEYVSEFDDTLKKLTDIATAFATSGSVAAFVEMASLGKAMQKDLSEIRAGQSNAALKDGDIMAFFDKEPLLTVEDLFAQGPPDFVPGPRPSVSFSGVGRPAVSIPGPGGGGMF